MRLALTITWCIVLLALIAVAMTAFMELRPVPEDAGFAAVCLAIVWIIYRDEITGGNTP